MSDPQSVLKKADQYLKNLSQRGVKHLPSVKAPKENVTARAQASVSGSNKQEALEALKKTVLPCTLCPELAKSRKTVVFGTGNADARLMFVGEAPGFDEDQQGLPFVGKAGQLLTKIIESIGMKREDVFIANVLKCRPPGNRNPLPEEVMNCQPYLKKQIEIIQPLIICALGKFAVQTLLQTDSSISRIRGQWNMYEGVKVMPTFHPAYLLRNPADKRKVWEDMKMIRDTLKQLS